MAKQDFLQGGYVGKLGATIGQRWKNIRTVRSYVKPHNPRTQAQQANRNNFKQAVELTQFAKVFNDDCPVWQSQSNTAYAERIKVAKTRIDRGVSGWQAVPLYPDGYTPTYTISDCAITAGNDNTWVITSSTLATLATGRGLTLCVQMVDTETHTDVDYFFHSDTVAGDGTLLSFSQLGRYQLADEPLIMGASMDDTEHNNETVYIAPQVLVPPQTVTLDDVLAEYQSNTAIRLTSTKLAGLANAYDITLQYEVQDASTDTKVMRTATFTTVAGNSLLGDLPTSIEQTMFSGCTITALDITARSGSVTLIIPDFTVSLGRKVVELGILSTNFGLTNNQRNTINGLIHAGAYVPNGTVNGTCSISCYDIEEGLPHTITPTPSYGATDSTGNILAQVATGLQGVISVLTNSVELHFTISHTWLLATGAAQGSIGDETQHLIEGVEVALNNSSSGNSFVIAVSHGTIQLSTDMYLKLWGKDVFSTLDSSTEPTGVQFTQDSSRDIATLSEIGLLPVGSGAILIHSANWATSSSIYVMAKQNVLINKPTLQAPFAYIATHLDEYSWGRLIDYDTPIYDVTLESDYDITAGVSNAIAYGKYLDWDSNEVSLPANGVALSGFSIVSGDSKKLEGTLTLTAEAMFGYETVPSDPLRLVFDYENTVLKTPVVKSIAISE